MKNLLKLFVVVFVISCGGSGGDDPVTPPTASNKVPTQPVNKVPTNNLLCINNVVQFEWDAATDEDGDAIKYELLIAKDNQFTQGVQTIMNLSTNATHVTLEKGVAYYWKVKAIDSKNASGPYSNVFQFYTEGTGLLNYAPFVPQLVSPTLHAIVKTSTAKLEWTASDVDNDALVFDVYFGSINPPVTKIAENQSEKNKTVTLTSGNEYFWKIVVKDGEGGESVGQVWRFKTD